MAQAYDEYGNPIEQQDPAAAWENAAGEINRWKDQNAAGGNIDWTKAQNAWNQSGGDLNKVYGASSQWMTPAQQKQAAQPFDYEGFRNDWLSQGFGTKGDSARGAQIAAKWGVKLDKGQHAYDPSGNYLGDLYGDVGGRNTVQFLRGAAGHATAAKLSGKKPAPKKPAPKGKDPVPKGGISPPGPGNLPPSTPPPPTSPPVTPPGPPNLPPEDPGSIAPVRDPRLDALYDELLKRSKQGLDVENDPVIRAQTDAYNAQEERARRNYISDLAERGGPNQNLQGEQRLAAERMGQNTGNMKAQLMAREVTAKRDEIQNALTQMQGLLTFEQEAALRKELAVMDDAVKRYSIDSENSRFSKGLAEQARQFNKDLEHRNKALAQQSRLAAQQLGYQYDSLEWVRNPANPANRL